MELEKKPDAFDTKFRAGDDWELERRMLTGSAAAEFGFDVVAEVSLPADAASHSPAIPATS